MIKINDLVILKNILKDTKIGKISNDGLRAYLKLSMSINKYAAEFDEKRKTLITDAISNKGYNIDALTIRNYEQLGVSYEELVSVKRQFRTRTNSERIYLHKGFVWVFAGKDACVLKTVIKLRIIPIKKRK